MNAYDTLGLYIARHQYTKGAYKGQAPADKSRRAKSHFRVTPTPTTRVVRFHATDILTAYPDGTIRLHTNGWDTAPTTREALWDAIKLATGRTLSIHSRRHNGLSQTAIGQHCYYDGMVFDSDLNLLSTPAPFQAYAADREATKALRDAAAPLRAMLPILVAAEEANPTSTAQRYGGWYQLPGRTDADKAMYAFANPEHWSTFVAYYYCPEDTAKTLWARAYAALTKNMRKVVEV